MHTAELIAIDVHTHAELSCWNPFDNDGEAYDRAADKDFGSQRRPSIGEAAQANSDMMICFGSIDPHKGTMGHVRRGD